MKSNDQILLDQVVEEERTSRMPTISRPEFFELYVAEQVLKTYDLSDDEFEYGLVGSGNDGGVDSLYTFANGELVQEDFDPSALKKNILIEVVIIQAKTSASFGEDAIHKLMAVTNNLFQLSKQVSEFKQLYNEGIRSAVENFRKLYTSIAGKFPNLSIRYIYATSGDSKSVHPNTRHKANELGAVVSDLFPTAKFEFQFLGASELVELARRRLVTSYEVEVAESLAARDGYISLVRLTEYIKFIRSPDGNLNKKLFEANVRDYQGSNLVNEEMQKALKERGEEDFWWLNNGVTIVATKAVQGGKVLSIEDPQIVNGQQTSTEIFNYFSSANTSAETRSVMVRVIVANDASVRDRIIKATNSQTSIPAASLRATDKIHRDIEAYLAPFGVYYDRRKNSQKQLGRPADRIIGISLLAQAVMAIALQRPADARARPSSLIKNEHDYKQLFNGANPIALYLFSALLIKRIHGYLRSREELAPKDRNNFLFYVAMYVGATLAGESSPSIEKLAAIDLNLITADVLNSAVESVEKSYALLGGNDQVAKGKELTLVIREELRNSFPAT